MFRSIGSHVNTLSLSSMSILTPQLSIALPGMYDREIFPTVPLMSISHLHECTVAYFWAPD